MNDTPTPSTDIPDTMRAIVAMRECVTGIELAKTIAEPSLSNEPTRVGGYSQRWTGSILNRAITGDQIHCE